MEEVSKLFTDALSHELDDPSKFVRLYALVGNLRLIAAADVISRQRRSCDLSSKRITSPIEIFAIQKTDTSPTSMCFGHLAKLAVKS
jgi:hypothetical protein